MKALEWSPGLMQQPGLQRLYWDESAKQTRTNPRCPGGSGGQHPSAWQLILPP